ncbi:hypothetical protein LOD99_9716 [Oopsacas minuta]|uniref:Uncharacterized protein n=1 Tax=Oopsacas minuta TaxID=111878 RepID=A0AAV7KLS3_9METZ|nr:hypothetical protein LOD99_9716 [Oopsacas minuta]
MTSLSEDIITNLTQSLDEVITDHSQDIDLALDTPLPDLSPSGSPSPVLIARPASRLDPILPRGVTGVRKKKKRRIMKHSPSIQLDTVMPTSNRPLPPLETDSSSPVRAVTPNEPPPHVHLQQPLNVSYEPIHLLSVEDIASHTETTILGNPISTHNTQSQFLMKSEKAFFERKDGRFIPVSKQDTPPIDPIPHSNCSSRLSCSRTNLAHICNPIFHTFGLLSHSLLVGITIWHTVFVYTLASYSNLDLNSVLNVSKLSLPSHCIFYSLSTVTVVYLADRIDLPSLNRKYVLEAFHKKQYIIILNVIAFFLTSLSLIICLSLMYIDLQIHYISLPYSDGWDTLWPDLLTNSTTQNCQLYSIGTQSYYPVDIPVSDRVLVFKILLLVRAILCTCSWLLVESCPTHNRWYLYVKRVIRD